MFFRVSSLSLHSKALFFPASPDRQTDGLLIEMSTETAWRQHRTRPPPSNYTLKSWRVSCFLSCGICGKREWKSTRPPADGLTTQRVNSPVPRTSDRWMEEELTAEVELVRQRRPSGGRSFALVWRRRRVSSRVGNALNAERQRLAEAPRSPV